MSEYDCERIQQASKEALRALIESGGQQPLQPLLEYAEGIRRQYYGKRVFFRGLIEFTNYCKHDCHYCGLQRSNRTLHRYRLSQEEVLTCCEDGYARGFRSLVLQGGEDPFYNGGRIVELAAAIKKALPDCSLTLSVGELPHALYQALREAGTDRFLLRHETADAAHYARLHPQEMTLDTRKECLYAIKKTGMAVGAGFMVGSPYQTAEHLAGDLLFLKELQPHMVGVGPFLPQSKTQFSGFAAGGLYLTLNMLALVRLMLPKVLLPATTALGTLSENGRELGLKAGANVVMPNLTPLRFRKDYMLYDNKIGVDDGVGEGLARMIESVEKAGYTPDFSRGDHIDHLKTEEAV
jgi:biotin synthase